MAQIGKGIKCLVLAILLTFCAVTVGSAQVPETTAKSAVVLDGLSGEILFEKDPHEPRAPASMTKIMTLLLAFEAIEKGRVSLDDRVTVTESVNTLGDDPGTWVWLEPGEVWPLEELLVAIAVASANDACIAVAEHIAGSEAAFVDMMNQKAGELGMANTNFRNPHGLSDDEHFMSAYDTAILSREALKYPKLIQLTSIYDYPRFRPEPRRLDLWNTNKLLVWYDGVDGLKTGWTESAGYCLATTAYRDGLRLVSVVMGCPAANSHFSESIQLLQWGFANFKSEQVVAAGQVMDILPVLRGKAQEIELVAVEDLHVTLPRGDEAFEIQVELEIDRLIAPVEKGRKCGQLQVWRDGKKVGQVELATRENVDKGSPFLAAWRLFLSWFTF